MSENDTITPGTEEQPEVQEQETAPDYTPLDTKRWRKLPPLVRDVICLVLDTADTAGEVFEMVQGEVVIEVKNGRADAIRQSKQLRRGKELPQLPQQPQRIVLHRDPTRR